MVRVVALFTLCRADGIVQGGESDRIEGERNGMLISTGPALTVGSCSSGNYLTDGQIADWGQSKGMENLCKSTFCASNFDAWHTNMDGHETCKTNVGGHSCVDGWIRCQYGSTCNGHYYWYVKVSPSDGYCSGGDLLGSPDGTDNVLEEKFPLVAPGGMLITAEPAPTVGSCSSGNYLTDGQIADWGQSKGMENLCKSTFCASNFDAWHTNMDGRETCKTNVGGHSCVDGWIRCQYGSTCNGHYYWYVKVPPSDGYCSAGAREAAFSWAEFLA